jgi:M6 family metalloprotease-like protein
MNKYTLFLLCCIYALMLTAVPAKRERCILTLADGSTIEATWMGDEMMHFYQTDDGKHLQCDNEGIAHFVDTEMLLQKWKTKSFKRQATRSYKQASRRRKAREAMSGNKRGLVILVQFPKLPFHFTNTTFQHFFNEKGYFDDINTGSVHDYFLDASYGKFDFSFDIIGPITMSHPLSYYGENNLNGDDAHPALMVAEAIHMIDQDVDFSLYDWDRDGEVEQIFLIHSGYDEAQSHTNNDIWSHAWTLSEAREEGDGNGPVTVDGVLIDSYATSAELRDRTDYNIAGIGTACHEFSHCFGLPDFYDTDGRNFGMNTWSLMDYGEYNGDGGTPVGFTSYERMFCGWLNPIELNEPIRVTNMPPLTSEPVAYILRNSGKYDEYYLFENRQKEGWDKYIGGHGMLVLHVDYDSLAWAENAVNVMRMHQRMTIIPADNILYSSTLAGDTWPGISSKTELSSTSTPAATVFNPNANGEMFIGHTISEISESTEGLISFVFDEEILGISSYQKEEERKKTRIYDLQGKKLPGPQRGIIIRDGKKTLIR